MSSEKQPIEKIKEISTAYWKSQTLFTALKLNLFKEMRDKTLTLQDLCSRLGADPHGLEPLLLSLTALGLMEKTDRGYWVEESYRPYLTEGGDKDFSGAISHMDHLQATWQRLDESVRSGGPIVFDEEIHESEIQQRTERFMAAMESIASNVSQELIRQFPLNGDEEILDLGCGPGTYFRTFLKTYPEARATAVDTEDVIPITRHHVEREDLSGRVAFVPGDFYELSFKNSFYHLVILSNIIHMFTPDRAVALCEKIYSALSPGGTLLINDFFTDETGTRPRWGALFSLNMLLNTDGGKNYRLEDGKRFLQEAGFVKIRSKPLCMDATLLIGTKQGS